MPRYRHVLVAFDGSTEAELALDHAIAMAQVYRARLALVAVVAPPPLLAWQAPGGMRGIHESEQTELEAALRRAADRVPDDMSVTTRLLDGDPARELLRAAARRRSRRARAWAPAGAGRMTAALLGSVSNRVMHDAEIPVIVIHRPRGDAGPGPGGLGDSQASRSRSRSGRPGCGPPSIV